MSRKAAGFGCVFVLAFGSWASAQFGLSEPITDSSPNDKPYLKTKPVPDPIKNPLSGEPVTSNSQEPAKNVPPGSAIFAPVGRPLEVIPLEAKQSNALSADPAPNFELTTKGERIDGLIAKLKALANSDRLAIEENTTLNEAIAILTHVNGKMIVDVPQATSQSPAAIPQSNVSKPASTTKEVNPFGPFSVSQGKAGAVLLDKKTGKTWWLETTSEGKNWVEIGRPDKVDASDKLNDIPESPERRQVGGENRFPTPDTH
jgi:hypothetical protein